MDWRQITLVVVAVLWAFTSGGIFYSYIKLEERNEFAAKYLLESWLAYGKLITRSIVSINRFIWPSCFLLDVTGYGSKPIMIIGVTSLAIAYFAEIFPWPMRGLLPIPWWYTRKPWFIQSSDWRCIYRQQA